MVRRRLGGGLDGGYGEGRGRKGEGLCDELLKLGLQKGQSVESWESKDLVRTSKAYTISDATVLGGGPRLCWAEIKLIRSAMCCNVGALVTDAR